MSKLGEFERYQVEPPGDLSSHPSMMSDIERRMCYGLARDWYEGQGRIVDAGIFLGASTRLFGHGISENVNSSKIRKRYKKPIISYEHGQLGSGMPSFFKRHNIETEGLVNGTDFTPLLMTMIKDVERQVKLNIGDIRELSWQGDPIELLFLDILKFYDINQHVVRTFYPYLIPGRSIIIHQDYFYDHQPFIRTTQEYLSPYFEYIGNAQSSAYFRLTKAIPQAAIETAAEIEHLPHKEKMALIDQSIERIAKDEDRAYLVSLSKVRQVLADHGKAAARETLANLASKFPEQASLQTPFKNRIKLAVDLLNQKLADQGNVEVDDE